MPKKLLAEILFWLVTLVITGLILLPVYNEYEMDYPFYRNNISFIILFLTLTRYMFLLKYSPISHNKLIKVVLLFACIPLFLYMLDGFYDFQRFLDEVGLQELSANPISNSAKNLAEYTRYQYLFSAVGGLICLVLFPFRMVISMWRQYNKGTV